MTTAVTADRQSTTWLSPSLDPSATNLPQRLIITIDGTAGTGKTTVARGLSQAIGARYLDTGAMYRAAALLTRQRNVPLDQHDRIADLVREADIHFRWSGATPLLQAFGRDVDDADLRHPSVSEIVSPIATISQVRSTLVARQRRIGEIHPRLVSEGRDQGTVVFFDADVKFYLDASPRVRAERRAAELRSRGIPADASTIECELLGRDKMDSGRSAGPLTKPADAVEVDTSSLDQQGVIDHLAAIVIARVGRR
jgi:cytidylate kinase